MTYTIKTNPYSKYAKVKPHAQRKALERNGSKFVTIEHRGRSYNGRTIKIDKRLGVAIIRLAAESSAHCLRLRDITRIKAQGLIMEY